MRQYTSDFFSTVDFHLSLHLLSMCTPNTVHEYSFEFFRFLCQSVDMKESSTETQRDFQKVCAWSQYRWGEFMNECVKVLSQRRYVSHAFLSVNPWLLLESIRRIPAYHIDYTTVTRHSWLLGVNFKLYVYIYIYIYIYGWFLDYGHLYVLWSKIYI